MRIGINALYLLPGKVGGTESYLRSLLPALAQAGPEHEFYLYLNREAAGTFQDVAANVAVRGCGVNGSFRPARLFFESLGYASTLRRDHIDVVLNAGFTGPLFAGCPSVTVIHDLQFREHPEFFRWYDLPFWHVFVSASLWRATAIIAISDEVASCIARWHPWTASRLHVVEHGVAPEFFDLQTQRHPDAHEVLCVSTLHPHKNIHRLLDAFQLVHRIHPRYKLVLTGMRGFAAKTIEERRDRLGLQASVTITGWVPQPELMKRYREASAFIYPSLFEGFGMPVLEALAAGIPTACSAIEPLRTLSGGAALLFNPLSVKSLADALVQTMENHDFRRSALAAGPRVASAYTWESTARKTLAALTAAHAAKKFPRFRRASL